MKKVKESAMDRQSRSTGPIRTETCRVCKGSGTYNGKACFNCGGKGWHVQFRKDVDEELHLGTLMEQASYEQALKRFLELLQQRETEYIKKNYQNLKPATFSVDSGKVYDRIVRNNGVQRSAYCFIRKSDGAILKAAGWKAPAKHERGNIYASTPLGGTNPYGADYLR